MLRHMIKGHRLSHASAKSIFTTPSTPANDCSYELWRFAYCTYNCQSDTDRQGACFMLLSFFSHVSCFLWFFGDDRYLKKIFLGNFRPEHLVKLASSYTNRTGINTPKGKAKHE